jgi:hypothetical protein
MGYLVVVRVMAVTLGLLCLWTGATVGQEAGKNGRQQPAPERVVPARTRLQAHPQLHGVWNFATMTPLERPSEFAGKEVLSDEELAALRRKDEDRRDFIANRSNNGVGSYNSLWFENGNSSKQTALIVDPVDGRLPPLTSQGQTRRASQREAAERSAGPEDRSATDRCIVGFNAGPPIIPNLYNNNVLFLDTGDYFVIMTEMVHDVRIVPLDGRPHGTVRQWMGDSRGRWVGDTLVIETINFTDKGTGTLGLSPTLDQHARVTERFRLLGPDVLLYEFTVDDPTLWTRPWTARVTMTKSAERIYEYACHEGNYGLANILSAARALEKQKASAR